MRLFINRPLFIILSSVTLSFPFRSQASQDVCIGKVCVSAEVAATPAQREKGLMFRRRLPDKKGMLFVFDKEDIYPFWMKNTNIPLDMIWIGEDKRVVFICERALPCKEACASIMPAQAARYVLEVNAGFVRKYRIRVGEEVRFLP